MENSALSGRVHSFQSMGAVDGPGLRYVVFFQGCPLRCAYCHNPDTWAFEGGQEVTVEEVLQKVRRCAPYIKKNGGVTLTGGEPLAQSAFAAALLAALKAEGFHTALDTSGAASLESAAKVLEHTDLVLADLKFTTEEDYRRHTGGSLAHTLEFLSLCREMGRPVWLRHVVVPGLNDGPEAAARLAALAKRYDNVEKVELLPFRTLCIEKYAALGLPFPLEGTPPAGKEHLAPFYEALGPLAKPAK